MTQPLPATDRLKWLLRTYIDAPTEYDPTPPGPDAGTTTLPGRWHYYRELDTWLRTMRTCTCPPGKRHHPHCMRQPFNHLNERYIRPHARTELRIYHGKWTRTRNGTITGLPPHTELANPHTIITRPVMIARWHHWARADQYNHALAWLLEHMHDGRTDRINLPPDLFTARAEHTSLPARNETRSTSKHRELVAA